MGFDINQKHTKKNSKKLTGLLQILWIKYSSIDTGEKKNIYIYIYIYIYKN